MALRNPPSWLQQGSHTAENDRLTHQALYSSSGVIANSLLVSAPGGMAVSIASGWASVLSSTSNAGVYVGYNDAAATVSLVTADPTNPRIDLIVATVADAAYSGSTNSIIFQAITGTPAASPAVPSTPSNSVALAQVAVAAGTNNIVSGNITDLRVPAISNAVQNPIQSVRLLSSGSAIGAAALPFGATSRAQIISGRNYLVDIILPFTKTTLGTVTWRLNTSAGSHTFAGQFSDSLNQSVSASGTAATALTFVASASYATATNYVTRFSGTITAGANARLFLDISAISAGTITPLAGASFVLTDLGPNATIGNIG